MILSAEEQEHLESRKEVDRMSQSLRGFDDLFDNLVVVPVGDHGFGKSARNVFEKGGGKSLVRKRG